MALTNIRPMSFTVRPINRGLNREKPPQEIDVRESSNLFDVRFSKGLVEFRNGFRKKYRGPAEYMLWLDLVFSLTESKLIGLGYKGIYSLESDLLELVPLYDADGSSLSYPYLNMDPLVQYLSVDAGFGQYQFAGANGGALFPGADTYETITVFCNGTTDGIFALAYTASGAEGERMGGGICPSLGRSISIWDGRVFVGGDQNDSAKITWSSKGLLSDWTVASGAGSTVIGDSPDWIQAMRKLGEYLIVYKERSIFIGRQTYLTDPPVRFDPAPGQGIGLAAPNSVGDLGEEHIFLGWDNVYIFSLQRIEAIGTQIKDELFYGEHGILPKYLGNCTGIIAEEFDEYWLFIPSGKWPNRVGASGDDLGIVNLVTDPLCEDLTKWGGVSAGLNEVSARKLGNGAFEFASSVQWITQTIDFGEAIGADREFSLKVLFETSVEETITLLIHELASDDTLLDSHSNNGESSSTGYQGMVLSCVTTEATAQKIKIEIRATAVTYIDAVHLVEITDISNEFVINSGGYNSVGYLGPDEEPREIPIIVDTVGPWMPDTCWVYNYSTNAWSRWRIPMTGFGYDSIQTITAIADLQGTIAEQNWRFDEKRIADFAPTNLIAQPDGQIYEVASGYFKDFGDVLDVTFPAYWQSKDFDLGRPDIEKTVSRVTIYHETSHAPINVDIGYSTDSGLSWQEQTIAIATGRFETHVNMFVTGPQVRFRFKADSPGFHIHGFSAKILPRGETNVY